MGSLGRPDKLEELKKKKRKKCLFSSSACLFIDTVLYCSVKKSLNRERPVNTSLLGCVKADVTLGTASLLL